MRLNLALGLALSVLAFSPAAGQTATSEPQIAPQQSTQDRMAERQTRSRGLKVQPDGSVSALALIGRLVHTPSGEPVGEVADVAIGPDGRASTLVVVTGGFLALGERKVSVPFERVQLRPAAGSRGTVSVTTTRETLASAPEWNRD